MQSVPTNGVIGFTALAGDDILVVANGGHPGNREIDTQVYGITEEEELVMVSILQPHIEANYQSMSIALWLC